MSFIKQYHTWRAAAVTDNGLGDAVAQARLQTSAGDH